MTTKNIYILFLMIFAHKFYAQNSYPIIFNIKGKIFTPPKNEYKNNGLIKVATLKADIKIKEGNFSILLIDFNENGNFNDYRGCCKETGSDGIIITDYKENKVTVFYNKRRFITKNYPISFNGNTFKLMNLHKNKKGFYEAYLVKRTVNLDAVFKTRNRVIIDSLPNLTLNNYYNKHEVKLLDKLQKDKKLLLKVISLSEFPFYLKYGDDIISKSKNINNIIKKYYPNTIIETIVIVKNRSTHNFLVNKFNPEKKDFLIINALEKEKIMQLGNNMYQSSIMLFNEKGKVIFTDYNNFIRLKDLEKNKVKTLILN